jgi:hypothetical protein
LPVGTVHKIKNAAGLCHLDTFSSTRKKENSRTVAAATEGSRGRPGTVEVISDDTERAVGAASMANPGIRGLVSEVAVLARGSILVGHSGTPQVIRREGRGHPVVTASIKADALALANQLLHFRAEVGVGQAALVLGVRLQLEKITKVIQWEI